MEPFSSFLSPEIRREAIRLANTRRLVFRWKLELVEPFWDTADGGKVSVRVAEGPRAGTWHLVSLYELEVVG